jgi:hypothetical protein
MQNTIILDNVSNMATHFRQWLPHFCHTCVLNLLTDLFEESSVVRRGFDCFGLRSIVRLVLQFVQAMNLLEVQSLLYTVKRRLSLEAVWRHIS